MGTQPLERESSARKPSRIGEEIRKELEKRGLRAPKADKSKPNGKKIASSGDVPIQITVSEESREEIDIEVTPVEKIVDEETVEEVKEVATEIEVVTNEEDVAEHLVERMEEGEGPEGELQSGENLEAPISIDEGVPAGLEDSTAAGLLDTQPLDPTGTREGDESDEISEEVVPSDPKLLHPPKAAPDVSLDDQPSGAMLEGPNFIILPQEELEETDVDLGPLMGVEEITAEPGVPPSVEEKIVETQVEVVTEDAVGEVPALASDLPETAELDDETVEVLRSYRNIKSPDEIDLDLTDRSEVIENLLSIASHELRSPLQAISGFLELLINSGSSSNRQEAQFLSIAYRESNHLADIVADLEAASLIESGKLTTRMAPFSMDDLLQSCIERYNQPEWEGQILLADARLKDLPDLHGDELYLRQALNNLISAVLRPLRAGNHVFIRTIVDEYDLILQVLTGEENPSDVTLPDLRAARGEFYDIMQEGLGIFVARHIIEAHGGVLLSEGSELEGLRYTIQIPLKPRSESRGTVLITEDNTHAALLMEYALERDGYIPIKATNGLEALEIVANDSVDLVILDVVLPGMDGFEICYRMRSSPDTASIPVIIVSAKTGDEYRAKALRVGADAYFRKPLVLANLLLTMDKLLENGEMNELDEEFEEPSIE